MVFVKSERLHFGVQFTVSLTGISISFTCHQYSEMHLSVLKLENQVNFTGNTLNYIRLSDRPLMEKSCSSSGEVFCVCAGEKNQCRHRLSFAGAGFAKSREEKTPLEDPP